MSPSIDKTEQIVIAILEILLVIARNSRKIRKQLDKKTKPIKTKTDESETNTKPTLQQSNGLFNTTVSSRPVTGATDFKQTISFGRTSNSRGHRQPRP